MRSPAISLAVVVALLAPSAARPWGGHGKIGCLACHGPKKVEGTSAFCLQCHATTGEGGRGVLPISKHTSHPIDVAAPNPRVARIPPELARPDGRFGCLSCHDPHPSNASHAYLRVDTGPKGARMDAFCAACHPVKSDRTPGAIGGATPRR